MTEPQASVAQARRSALVVALVFALLGAWQLHRVHAGIAYGLWVAALAVMICAAIAPAALWFNRYWMMLAAGLGYVNSRILLSAVYYLLMTPVGAALRLSGYDPLGRRGAKKPSYWVKRDKRSQTHEGFERSF